MNEIRAKYIEQGLISWRTPDNPAIQRPLNADQLATRGFTIAAAAKLRSFCDAYSSAYND